MTDSLNGLRATTHGGARVLWLPFLLMTISVMMILAELTYLIYSYIDYFIASSLPDPSQGINFLFTVINSLGLPLFVLSVALLLMFLTKVKKGTVTWSRMAFFAGALLLLAGSAFYIAESWEFYHRILDPFENYDSIINLGIAAGIATSLGTALCFVASLLLVRSYLKGEICRDSSKVLA